MATLPPWLEPMDAKPQQAEKRDEPTTFAELNAKDNDDAPVKYGGRRIKPGHKANQEDAIK